VHAYAGSFDQVFVFDLDGFAWDQAIDMLQQATGGCLVNGRA